MYKTPKKINCQMCGCETMTGSGSGKFCEKCKIINKRNWRRDHGKIYRLKERQDKHLYCKICLKNITEELWTREYCHNCRPKSVKLYSRKYYLINRGRHLAYTKAYYQIPGIKAKHRVWALKSYYKRKAKLLDIATQKNYNRTPISE